MSLCVEGAWERNKSVMGRHWLRVSGMVVLLCTGNVWAQPKEWDPQHNGKPVVCSPTPRHVPGSGVETQTLLRSAFARYVFRWGQRFQTKMPKGWRMDWEPSQLTEIQWQAGPQLGYQIRFEHVSKKVPIPVPFPDFRNPGGNTLVVPMRCSLHFFPRTGEFVAHDSRISRMKPATVLGVTSQAIVLQPDRFMAKEYPCPDILRAFSRFIRGGRRGQVHPQIHQTLRRMKLRRYRVQAYRHHVAITITGPKQTLPWKKLLSFLRKKTLLVQFRDPLQRWDMIFHD